MKQKDMSRRAVVAGAVGLGVMGASLSFAGGGLAPVRVFSFPGNLNLLIWAGQEKGFFRDEGLDVSHDLTPTSMVLMEKMVVRDYDIAISSIDNVIAYNAGQGQVPLPRPADFFGFMNVSGNMELPLITRKGITGFEALRGAKLAVDAVSTGFSFVLRKILETHGVMPGEYELVSVGNSAKRYKALVAGEYDGAILTPPFNFMAKGAGLNQLGSNRDFNPDYQGTCFVATRRLAAEKPEVIQAFARALLSVFNWLGDDANNKEAAAILAKNNKAIDENAARGMVRGLAKGLSPDFNRAGIETVLRLRTQFAPSNVKLGALDDFVDGKYLKAARASG